MICNFLSTLFFLLFLCSVVVEVRQASPFHLSSFLKFSFSPFCFCNENKSPLDEREGKQKISIKCQFPILAFFESLLCNWKKQATLWTKIDGTSKRKVSRNVSVGKTCAHFSELFFILMRVENSMKIEIFFIFIRKSNNQVSPFSHDLNFNPNRHLSSIYFLVNTVCLIKM